MLWGFIAPFIAIFRRYDRYIFTSPPESMLIGAYVMQCLGKTVIIDMRDSIERERQTVKILVPLYRFFYRRMKNVIVSYQFLDETKPVVYHGYEELDAKEFQGYYNERVSKKEYNARLLCGYIPDQSFKPTGYSAGSVQTFRHLGFPVNNRFHAEIHEHKLVSVRGSVKRLHALIKSL